MKKWIIMGTLALTLGLTASVVSAGHSWGNYHWARTANPFTIQLVDSVTTNWDGHLNTVSTDWSASTVLDTQIESGAEDPTTRKRCPAPNGKVRVCNALYGFNGWLGLATIGVSGTHIEKGTAKLNDSYLDNPGFITPYETPAWRQYVMCQEPGHTLGLGHQDETFGNVNLGSCMDYTDDPDGTAKGQASNLHPNQHDYDQLSTIYNSHVDESTGGGNGNKGKGKGSVGNDDGASNGEDFGEPTGKKDGKGRDILFEKDLGGGKKQFTWVLWADWHPSNAN